MKANSAGSGKNRTTLRMYLETRKGQMFLKAESLWAGLGKSEIACERRRLKYYSQSIIHKFGSKC